MNEQAIFKATAAQVDNMEQLVSNAMHFAVNRYVLDRAITSVDGPYYKDGNDDEMFFIINMKEIQKDD
jgi:hypothetical protein